MSFYLASWSLWSLSLNNPPPSDRDSMKDHSPHAHSLTRLTVRPTKNIRLWLAQGSKEEKAISGKEGRSADTQVPRQSLFSKERCSGAQEADKGHTEPALTKSLSQDSTNRGYLI